MTSPKHTWKRLHQIATGIPDWQDYLNAVQVYADKVETAYNPKKHKRRKRRAKRDPKKD